MRVGRVNRGIYVGDLRVGQHAFVIASHNDHMCRDLMRRGTTESVAMIK
jgi:hypothetical protein